MEMMSEQIAELATALSKAQGEFKVAGNDKKNPHFKSSYASLESIHDAIKEPLAKNGLSISHLIGGGKIYTTLLHASGQYMRCEFDLPEGTVQQKGSALSYFKRYGLCCLLAIATGDDEDDGNKAEEAGPIASKSVCISFTQVKELEEALEHDETRISNLLRFHNIDNLTKFPLKEFGALMAKYKKVAK